MAVDYSSVFAGLTEQQQLFCEGVLRGMPKGAAAGAAGYKHPAQDATRVSKMPGVVQALAAARSLMAAELGRDRVFMDKKLEEAWHNATNTIEQVAVIREWKKLHGLDAPTKVQHEHKGTITHEADFKELSTAQLRELAAGHVPLQLTAPDVLEGEFIEVGNG